MGFFTRNKVGKNIGSIFSFPWRRRELRQEKEKVVKFAEADRDERKTSKKKLERESKDEKKKAAEIQKKSKFVDAYKILVKPIVTEKTAKEASSGKYVFEVAKGANKVEIKKAIYEVYGVMPNKVAIMNQSGKEVRRGKVRGRTKEWKKAVVTVKDGAKLDIYSGV